jgi:hypothetical protein
MVQDQIRQMEELNKRLPHSVRLYTQCSEDIFDLNCFMFALGLEPHAVADMRIGHIFPGERFVQFLLADEHLIENDDQVFHCHLLSRWQTATRR